jgi:hypothetical protein
VGYYINQKCGSCNKSLTGGYVRIYSGIAQPFVECSRCGALNDNSDRCTEWQLKSSLGQIMFVAGHMLGATLTFGAVAGMAGTLLLATKAIHTLPEFIGLVVLSIAFGVGRFLYRLNRAIEESNNRMSDPRYVAKLRQLGLAG